MAWGGLGWLGVAWGGLGWLGVAWGGLGWLGVAWKFDAFEDGMKYLMLPPRQLPREKDEAGEINSVNLHKMTIRDPQRDLISG